MTAFLSMVLSALDKILSSKILLGPFGLTLYSLFFFNMFIVSFWVVFTRRG